MTSGSGDPARTSSEIRWGREYPSTATLQHASRAWFKSWVFQVTCRTSPCLDGGSSFCRRTDGRLGDAGCGKSPVCLTMRRHGAKNADYRGGVTCLYDTHLLGACLHASESGGRSRPEARQGHARRTNRPPSHLGPPRRGGRLSALSAQPLSTGGCGRVCLGFWVLDP